jgi:hypothetical protein
MYRCDEATNITNSLPSADTRVQLRAPRAYARDNFSYLFEDPLRSRSAYLLHLDIHV